MPVSAWSTTAASNGAALGIDIAENCAAANINNAAREMMAQLKTKFDAVDALIGSGSYQPLDTDLTAIAALVSAANKMPYATGSGAWALADLSTFARTVLDDGDAATARTTLGALGSSASSLASPGYVAITIGASTLKIQWGTVTVGANSNGSITFPSAFSSFSVTVVSGGPAGGGDAGSIHCTSSSTASAVVSNTSGGSLTGQYISVGV